MSLLSGAVQIQLATNSTGNVKSATFSVTDPSSNASKATFTFPSYALFPIYGFQADFGGPDARS
jgi:hypothetical protein